MQARQPASPALKFAFVLLAAAMVILAATEVGNLPQLLVAGGICLGLIALRAFPRGQFTRVLCLTMASFAVLRYFIWRTWTTLEFVDWPSYTCALILYLAECYGILVFFLTAFINSSPVARRSPPLPEKAGDHPSVDIFVTSYNEDISLLRTTVCAAVDLDYPKEKLRVYLLDDGGTDQKCQASSTADAESARARRHDLTAMCRDLGATYLTRERNEHAKAGNINAALKQTSGDLVVIFDSDHVPTRDFLQRTVGFFIEDPKMFLVQTPHFFLNPDPVERNLDTFERMPSENEMFYRQIQHGLDYWNGSFFCGSAAVLRREALDEIGGIAGDTITEDAETAIALHARGWNSAYVGRPMVAGLAAETISGFMIQRMRWSQGMGQIFRLKNPLLKRGLTWPQRLCYFNSCFFWFFPFARLIYAVAPCAFLLFGLKIYNANFESFLSFALPYVAAVWLTSHYLFGRTRWFLVSEIYELLLSINCLPALLKALLRPRQGKFNVTPKAETLTKDYISPFATPFYFLIMLNAACLSFGIHQILNQTPDLVPVSLTMGWTVFNLVLLGGVLGATRETRQTRSFARWPVRIDGETEWQGQRIRVELTDISASGCAIKVPPIMSANLQLPSTIDVNVIPQAGRPPQPAADRLPAERLRLRLLRRFEGELDGHTTDQLGGEYDLDDIATVRAAVRLLYADSQRWLDFQNRRQANYPSLIATVWWVAMLSAKGYFNHFRTALGGVASRFRQRQNDHDLAQV